MGFYFTVVLYTDKPLNDLKPTHNPPRDWKLVKESDGVLLNEYIRLPTQLKDNGYYPYIYVTGWGSQMFNNDPWYEITLYHILVEIEDYLHENGVQNILFASSGGHIDGPCSGWGMSKPESLDTTTAQTLLTQLKQKHDAHFAEKLAKFLPKEHREDYKTLYQARLEEPEFTGSSFRYLNGPYYNYVWFKKYFAKHKLPYEPSLDF